MRQTQETTLEASLKALPIERQSQCAKILEQGKIAGLKCLEALKVANLLTDKDAINAVEALIKKDGSGIYAEEKADGISFIAKNVPESLLKYIIATSKVSGQTYRAAVQELGYDLTAVLERAIISIPPLELIPEDKIHKSEDDKDKLKVRGSLGTVLKREVYRIFDPKEPQQVGFFAWSQATKSLIAAFNPKLHERIAHRENVKSKKELNDEITQILKSLPPISITEAKETLKKGSTVIYGRLGSLLKDLQSAIDSAQGELAYLTEGEALISLSLDKPRIRGEGGGQLIGWFERFSGNLPKIIENDLENLKSKFSTESSEERRDRVLRLVAFRALHTYIDTETAVSGIIEDLIDFDVLKPDKALEFRGKHHPSLHSKSGELSVSEANQILLDAEPIREFRKAKNQEVLKEFKDEFLEALQYFKPLFLQTDGGWKEDSQGSSIPKQRLRKSIFGADTLTSNKPVLKYEDWKLIMKGIELEMAYPDERLPEGMSIKDFRTVVEGTVRSYRKVKIFRELLNKSGRDLELFCGNSPGDAPIEGLPLVGIDNPPSDLRIEGYPKNLKLIESLPFSVEEIILRVDDLAKRRWGDKLEQKEVENFKAELQKYAKFGLYVETPQVISILEQIKGLTPTVSVDFIEKAEAVFSSPFLFATFPSNENFDDESKVKWKYLTHEEMSQIRAIAAIYDKYPLLDKDLVNEAKLLRERFKTVQFLRLPPNTTRFDFKPEFLTQKLREVNILAYEKYIASDGSERSVGEAGDPLRILLGLRSLSNNYVPLSQVLDDMADFADRLVVVASPKSDNRLKPFGLLSGSSIQSAMQIKNHATRLIRNPEEPNSYFLGKRFIHIVKNAYLSGFFKIENDELEITFGKFAGQNAFNLVQTNDNYFRHLLSPTKSYPLEVKKLAQDFLAFKDGIKTKEEVLESAKQIFG